ncbi:MAG: hypothetical protein RSB55_04065, partial [Oscillospiraceae bacterium]
MPLVLDKNSIGFTADKPETEVTATMTDVWYLGVLTVEEYASLFPVGLDMSKVEYLAADLRDAVAQVNQETRLANRANAMLKLDVQQRFVWDGIYDGKDFGAYLSFTPQSWGVMDARETQAPQMTCTAMVKWTGPTTVPAARAAAAPSGLSDEEMAKLLGNGDAPTETTGTKDVTQESQEIQDFLYELYQEGLLQSNSDYDLSAFEARAKAEGTTKVTGDEADVNLDELLKADTANQADAALTEPETPQDLPADSSFSLTDIAADTQLQADQTP